MEVLNKQVSKPTLRFQPNQCCVQADVGEGKDLWKQVTPEWIEEQRKEWPDLLVRAMTTNLSKYREYEKNYENYTKAKCPRLSVIASSQKEMEVIESELKDGLVKKIDARKINIGVDHRPMIKRIFETQRKLEKIAFGFTDPKVIDAFDGKGHIRIKYNVLAKNREEFVLFAERIKGNLKRVWHVPYIICLGNILLEKDWSFFSSIVRLRNFIELSLIKNEKKGEYPSYKLCLNSTEELLQFVRKAEKIVSLDMVHEIDLSQVSITEDNRESFFKVLSVCRNAVSLSIDQIICKEDIKIEGSKSLKFFSCNQIGAWNASGNFWLRMDVLTELKVGRLNGPMTVHSKTLEDFSCLTIGREGNLYVLADHIDKICIEDINGKAQINTWEITSFEYSAMAETGSLTFELKGNGKWNMTKTQDRWKLTVE